MFCTRAFLSSTLSPSLFALKFKSAFTLSFSCKSPPEWIFSHLLNQALLACSSRSEEGRRPSERSEVYKFVAWGSREDRLGRSNLDLPIYISMVSAQLPSNKTKSRPLTVVHSHVSSACFFISCLLRCVHLRADMFIHRL